MKTIAQQCKDAYLASKELAVVPSDLKNNILDRMASTITSHLDDIMTENQKDLQKATASNMPTSLLDRLSLNKQRLAGMSDSLRMIASLDDPIGKTIHQWERPNGLKISKIRVPLGVIGMIYEARPNVTADAIALALKTNNSVVLRGSSSAYHSNSIITTLLQKAAEECGVSKHNFQLLEDVSREGVRIFVTMSDYLSLIIPRGGASLIKSVVHSATVPTIETGTGNCHIYIDKHADHPLIEPIIINAKTQRPSVCNACETILVHQDIANQVLPSLLQKLQDKGVEIRGCEQTIKLAPNSSLATEKDWDTEYLDLILAVKIVVSVEDAIQHISTHGSLHSEAILSSDKKTIDKFTKYVDASSVLINTSTRFTDGEEFGFGAEIGISTQKLHARGPMGLTELTTYKYLVEGTGQTRP